MLKKNKIEKTIAVLGCCLSLSGCWGNKPHKKNDTATIKTEQMRSFLEQEELNETVNSSLPTSKTVYYFNLNSDSLSNQVKNELKDTADYFRENPGILITLHGHADARGPSDFNEVLSQNRANRVKKYLAQHGVPSDQIEVYGHSNRELAVLGDTEEAHAKNRRVTLNLQ